MQRYLLAIMSMAFTLAACNPDSGQTPKIAGSQREALNEARAIEAQMQQAAEAARRNIDEQAQ